MRTRLLFIAISCFALVAVTAGQSKDPSRPAHPPFKWWAVDKYKQELKLQDSQSAEINKIFEASVERLRVDKDDFDRAQHTFSELMQKPSVAERDFQRAVDQLELARFNLNKERTLMLVRIHNVLTPEQRKGLDAIRRRNEATPDADRSKNVQH